MDYNALNAISRDIFPNIRLFKAFQNFSTNKWNKSKQSAIQNRGKNKENIQINHTLPKSLEAF